MDGRKFNDAGNTEGVSDCYNNDVNNCAIYGRLYDWYAGMNMDAQIPGWHLPTKEEWNVLNASLNNSTNIFGILGSGLYDPNLSYKYLNQAEYFLSSTDGAHPNYPTFFCLYRKFLTPYTNGNITTELFGKTTRMSVRLIKDANLINVNFNTKGGSTIASKNITIGNKLSQPISPTKTGYIFAGWYSNEGLTTQYDFNTAVTNNFTLYAKWNANTNTITFNTNGGNIIENSNVISGDTLTFPIYPIKDGYTFLGWYTDLGLSKYYNFNDIVISNFTLYAKWNANTNTITFNTNGGSTIGDSIIMSGNKLIPPVAPTKSGYIFVGWYSNEGLTTQYDFNTAVTNNFTLYAKWMETAIINGKTYKIITIGTQTWMAENLNDAGNTEGVSDCYNNDVNNCAIYGRLYDWYAGMNMDAQIPGWHLPTKEEWNVLNASLNNSTNIFGILGSGLYDPNLSYKYLNQAEYFLSSTDGAHPNYPTFFAYIEKFSSPYNSGFITNELFGKTTRLAIRFVKD